MMLKFVHYLAIVQVLPVSDGKLSNVNQNVLNNFCPISKI